MLRSEESTAAPHRGHFTSTSNAKISPPGPLRAQSEGKVFGERGSKISERTEKLLVSGAKLTIGNP